MFPSPDPGIYCLLQSTEVHPKLAVGVPPASLLSPDELARFERFSVPKRRRDWLLGRWTAKYLVRLYLGQASASPIPLDNIEILAGDDGAPYARVGQRLPLSLSISHSGSASFCAVCPLDVGEVGADIEQIEPRELSFVRTFFTARENAVVGAAGPAARDTLVNTLWSTKEAVLKALRVGLRADTRQIEITLPSLAPEWCRAAVTIEHQLLPSPSARVNAWYLVQPTHVLSLSLLTAMD